MTEDSLFGWNDELENEQERIMDASGEGQEKEDYLTLNGKAFLRIRESIQQQRNS